MAFFLALACFCSAAVCCSLLRRSCHTGLGRPTRMPVPPEVLLLLFRPCPGTSLLNMDEALLLLVVIGVGNGTAWAAVASSSAAGGAAAAAAAAAAATATAAAAGMAGAGPEDSPRELLREHGALLTLRGAGGALAALAFAPALVLALPLEPALALGFGFAGLALLKEPVAAPPPAEWPAERLLEPK